jgi:hypothetical protein
MLQCRGRIGRAPIKFYPRQVKSVFETHDVALELAPPRGVRRRAIISGEMPVERGQDAQKLVLS